MNKRNNNNDNNNNNNHKDNNNNNNNNNNNRSRKIFINQSLLQHYRKLYGLVKNLNNEDLIDSFWISSQSKPVSITHESDL